MSVSRFLAAVVLSCDPLARLMAAKVGEALKQQIIVENRENNIRAD